MMNKMKETKEIEEGRTNLRIRTEDKKAEENKAIDKAKITDSTTKWERGWRGRITLKGSFCVCLIRVTTLTQTQAVFGTR